MYSKNKRKDKFRRNGKWFIDLAHKDDPSDVTNAEVDPPDDEYREKTYSWLYRNYQKQIITLKYKF